MKIKINPSHIAILVPSVRKAADYLSQFKFEIGEEESFEETREIYVQADKRNSLLLMEVKSSGSYQRALKKRGPGVHHLAIDVLDIEKFLSSLSGSGWLLHLNSLKTIKNNRTAYLARPGFPALIEVQEKQKLMKGPLFVEEVSLNFSKDHSGLVKSVGLDKILKPSAKKSFLTAHGQNIDLMKLF